MPKISACIISFNEERKLEDCLRSLAGVVDEIVVVDSHSRDRTVEIARRYTERVIAQDWLGMGAQKAFAYAQATHDWVLNLDCDERLTPELARSVQAVREGTPECSAFQLARKTFYVYRWLDHCWYPEWRTRLFDRRLCEVRGTDPHEFVQVLSGSTGRLRGDLEHYSVDSLSHHLQTIDAYTTTAAQRILESNKPVHVLSPITRGAWAFIRLYFIQRGLLDGFAGFSAALLSGVYAFLKYAKVLTQRWQRS
jgi:glycosyltransferase involved in cell wall biosynthesis